MLPATNTSDGVAGRIEAKRGRKMLLLCLVVAVTALWPRPSHAQWRAGGMPVCTAPKNQQYPFIIEDGRGGAFIAWPDRRDSATTDWDIYAQRIDADGVAQWASNGVPVCTLAGRQIIPNLAPDGADGVIIAWQDLRNGTHSQIYAQRLSASGVPLWGAGGLPLRDSGSSQFLDRFGHPSIAADGAGGAIVVWEELVTGTDTDVHAQRIDAAGRPLWTPDGVAVSTAVSFQTCPSLVSDRVGGVIIAWEDWRFRPVAHVYAQRLCATGQAQWTQDGILVSSLAGDQRGPRLAPDGSGGAIFVYPDWRPDAYSDIYAQRVNAAGLLQWGSDGVPLCTARQGQYAPSIAADGSGGAIVAWEDTRTDEDSTCLGGCFYDIYAQRVSATGEPQWATDGTPVCTARGEQRVPVLVADGGGGAIVAWPDARGGIHGQRIDPLGAPQWAVDGVALTGGAGGTIQNFPVAISDGSGGAIVAWTDARDSQFDKHGFTNLDVYAARVTAAGPVDVPGRDTPPRFRLLAPRPNPMATTTNVVFALPAAQRVAVEIWDAAGKRVRTLAQSREYAAGTHTLTWDSRDGSGRLLPSGVYVVRLSTAGVWESRKIVLLR